MLHIKIDNGAGENRIDLDTKGIIAVIDNGENIASVADFDQIKGKDLFMMICVLDKVKDGLFKKYPGLASLYELHSLIEKLKGDDSDDDDDDPLARLFKEAKDI